MTPEETSEVIRLARELGEAQARVAQLEGALAATMRALGGIIAAWEAGESRERIRAISLAAAAEIRWQLGGGRP